MIQQGIADVYNDFSSGDAEVIGRRVGKLVGDIVLGIITAKGVDKAVKAIRASAEAGTLAALMGELKSGLKNVDDVIGVLAAVAEAITNAKFTRALLQGMRGFMDDMVSILDDVGMSASKFDELRPLSADILSSADRTAMKAVRDAIPMPTNETIMQKVITQGDIAKYLDGEYNQIGGYVARAQDVKQLASYDDIYNSLRLDYAGTAYNPATDECVGVIRFKTPQASNLEIPYSQSMGGNIVDGPPFTGNGFTAATNGQAIPEYKCTQYIDVYDGAELYTITKDGTETLTAVYDSYFGKFIDILE
jgi:hypothetical protein